MRSAEPIANDVPVDPIALEEDCRLKVEMCIVFLLELFDTTIRKTISCFQVQIPNAVKYIDYVSYYCSQFVILLNLISFLIMSLF